MNYVIATLEVLLAQCLAADEKTKTIELRTALAILHLFDPAVFVHATE